MATAKIENPKAYEFDGETGNQSIRELSVEELSQLATDQTEAAAIKIEADAKAAARASALAKLADLGLTAEEIAAL